MSLSHLVDPQGSYSSEDISGRPTMGVVPAEWLEEPGWPCSTPVPQLANDRLFPQSTRALQQPHQVCF